MAKILTLIILIDKEVNLFKKVVDAALKWTTIHNGPRQWSWVKNPHQRHGFCFKDLVGDLLLGKVGTC